MQTWQQLLFLFRAFFPSWKFFDRAGSLPRLSYQIEGVTPSWILAIEEPQRKWHHIFLNPRGNLFHAFQSLVDQLLLEANQIDIEKLSNATSYRLVENLVRYQIENTDPKYLGRKFKFKISILLPAADDVLISETHVV